MTIFVMTTESGLIIFIPLSHSLIIIISVVMQLLLLSLLLLLLLLWDVKKFSFIFIYFNYLS